METEQQQHSMVMATEGQFDTQDNMLRSDVVQMVQED